MIRSGNLMFHDALRPLMTPIELVQQHPRNPNEGDIELIAETMLSIGVYKSISAQQSTGNILEGNHRYSAMLLCGATEIPVTWLEVSDEDAMRIMLADNRTSEASRRNPHALEAAMKMLLPTEAGLRGSGYGVEDLTALVKANRAFDHMPLSGLELPGSRPRHRVIVDGYLDEERFTAFDASDVAETIVRLEDLGLRARGDVA